MPTPLSPLHQLFHDQWDAWMLFDPFFATYVGDQRYNDHRSGRACRTTQIDPPVALLHSEAFDTFSEARKREAQVKRWTRAKKETLATGDPTRLKHWKNRRLT